MCRSSMVAFIAFGLAVAGTSPQSCAQELPSGFYIGAFASGNFVDMDNSEQDLALPGPPPATFEGTANLDGVGGGLLLGFDLPIGNGFSVGVEADAGIANLSSNFDGHIWEADTSFTVRGRAGVNVAPGINLFATAGVAILDVEYVGAIQQPPPNTPPPAAPPPPPPPAAAPPPPAPPTAPTKVTDTLTGFVVGAGGEFETGFGFDLRFEYLYSSFDDWDFLVGTELYLVDTSSHVIRFGVTVPIGN
ncbi:MAG: outer membrane protein [Hyphomicrobiaceae bacterium]